MAAKASAASEEPVEVLFALHPNFNLTDFAGPLEALHTAKHDPKDDCKSHLFSPFLESGLLELDLMHHPTPLFPTPQRHPRMIGVRGCITSHSMSHRY
jgi:transcriptional regulator GlxA family with amidase domain